MHFPLPLRYRFLVALTVALCASFTHAQDAAEIRVMSFNIRNGMAKDGDNHWDKRHELVAETMREFNPDLLGAQEVFKFQADYLDKQLPDHTAFGRTREAKGEDGEQCTIFYRTERFTKLGGGHLWLSETPETAGSKSWDSSLPRIVSWLCLRDAKNPEKPICFFNTHFDHRGSVARKESAALIAARSRQIAASFGARVLVTGDFNAGEATDPYKAIVTDTEGSLIDTYRATHKEKSKIEGTFNGFKGIDAGARIDWILADTSWKILSANIVRKNDNGRYPSDHFPVTAIVR